MDKKKYYAEIARICHQTNRIICMEIGDVVPEVWEECSSEQKLSVENGVKHVAETPNLTNEENHNNWMAFKKENGWVYGKEKDEEKKTHPDLVPYAELPESQKIKDKVFRDVIEFLIG